MQDIIVYISLDTASKEKETLLPLILSFEGAFAYKEYNKAEDVAKAIDVAGLTADLRRERAMSIISESGVAVEKKAEEPAKTEEASKAKKKPAAKKAAKTEETEGEEAPKAKKTTRKSTKTEEKTEE